jgi:hypothetical protein
MKVLQKSFKNAAEAAKAAAEVQAISPNLVIVFGSRNEMEAADAWKTFKAGLPSAQVVGCSTAGEISSKGVTDNTVQVTAVNTGAGEVQVVDADIPGGDSAAAGEMLAKKVNKDGLKALLVLSTGHNVNGSALIDGIRKVLGAKVTITGGLAGDGANFQKTITLCNGTVSDAKIVAVAFRGDAFEISYGSMGGWKPFGPVRKVSKSTNNVVFEIDGEPALDLYKKYLGEEAKKLPASGLLYPFAILKTNQDESGLIRTILSVDEAKKSLTFAGDVAEGSLVRLMQAKKSELADGAKGAASGAAKTGTASDGFAVLVSCVGRKLVMGDDIDDEIDAVRDVFGKNVALTGFYSYGEICPQEGFTECKLHNQTMTITKIATK